MYHSQLLSGIDHQTQELSEDHFVGYLLSTPKNPSHHGGWSAKTRWIIASRAANVMKTQKSSTLEHGMMDQTKKTKWASVLLTAGANFTSFDEFGLQNGTNNLE